MKKIVISAIGKDRPGIVAGLTKTLFEAGCNLEDSAMTILEGEFAILLIAGLPKKVSSAALSHALQKTAGKLGLTLTMKAMAIARAAQSAARSATVSASGEDQTGILFHLSSLLARHKVNITDLSSRQIAGPRGKAWYLVRIEIAPPGGSLRGLEKALRHLGQKMGLDISLQPMRVEQL